MAGNSRIKNSIIVQVGILFAVCVILMLGITHATQFAYSVKNVTSETERRADDIARRIGAHRSGLYQKPAAMSLPDPGACRSLPVSKPDGSLPVFQNVLVLMPAAAMFPFQIDAIKWAAAICHLSPFCAANRLQKP